MAQRKISNYFALKPITSSSNDKSNEIISNIKQEPEVEFIGLLPQFQPDKTLLGNFKVKTEKDEKKKVECKICLKLIRGRINLQQHLLTILLLKISHQFFNLTHRAIHL
jgi:hypothetical protein